MTISFHLAISRGGSKLGNKGAITLPLNKKSTFLALLLLFYFTLFYFLSISFFRRPSPRPTIAPLPSLTGYSYRRIAMNQAPFPTLMGRSPLTPRKFSSLMGMLSCAARRTKNDLPTSFLTWRAPHSTFSMTLSLKKEN